MFQIFNIHAQNNNSSEMFKNKINCERFVWYRKNKCRISERKPIMGADKREMDDRYVESRVKISENKWRKKSQSVSNLAWFRKQTNLFLASNLTNTVYTKTRGIFTEGIWINRFSFPKMELINNHTIIKIKNKGRYKIALTRISRIG